MICCYEETKAFVFSNQKSHKYGAFQYQAAPVLRLNEKLVYKKDFEKNIGRFSSNISSIFLFELKLNF